MVLKVLVFNLKLFYIWRAKYFKSEHYYYRGSYLPVLLIKVRLLYSFIFGSAVLKPNFDLCFAQRQCWCKLTSKTIYTKFYKDVVTKKILSKSVLNVERIRKISYNTLQSCKPYIYLLALATYSPLAYSSSRRKVWCAENVVRWRRGRLSLRRLRATKRINSKLC